MEHERRRTPGPAAGRAGLSSRVLRVALGPDGQLGADPAVLGRLLLAACGLVSMLFLPWLRPTDAGWTAVTVVSVALGVLLLASLRVDFTRLPAAVGLVFPALVCAALFAISVAAPGLVGPLVGLLTLCFAYIGLTQPPGRSLWAVVPAAATFVAANNVWSAQIAVRVAIGCFIWLLLAELLAHSTARQRAMAAALRTAAHRDVLTGVPNRRDMQVRMATAVAGDTLVMCDLDHFKQLNDTRGHLAGDAVLSDFGSLLQLVPRADDYCARFGGEEFVLLLPRTTSIDAYEVVERMRVAWRTMQPGVTFSAGLATCHAGRTPADTLAAADAALYRAKQAGRDRTRAEGADQSVSAA